MVAWLSREKRACKTHLCLFYFIYTVETYRSPVETLCTNIDYYIPDDKGATKSFSEDAMARLREFLLGFFTWFYGINLLSFSQTWGEP